MSDFWKPTAEMFTGLIERPKMTDKLLLKPPFKYLFDIISETTKKTNFGKGLYVGKELEGDYHADKDKKIVYLQKIIKLVELVSGSTVRVDPKKIVAGLQPELTNQFLQELYKSATSGKSTDPYVKKILSGNTEPEEEEKVEKKTQTKIQMEKKKPERPPSAARIKKPAENTQTQPASKKQVVEEEDIAPPVVKEQKKPATQKKQEYSQKVKQIMEEGEQQVEAQKEVEKEEGKNKINLGKLGGKKGKKEASEKIISNTGELNEKELELLQTMIQTICQNTAPLGKSIEFVNDDLDAMNKQLTFWRKQYNTSKAKTQAELKTTEEALNPVYDKIREIQDQILDQKAKIQTTKSQILKNDSIIRDLLMSVVTTK